MPGPLGAGITLGRGRGNRQGEGKRRNHLEGGNGGPPGGAGEVDCRVSSGRGSYRVQHQGGLRLRTA